MDPPLPPLPLPPSIRQRYLDLTTNPTCGLTIFLLEAGSPTNPLVLLLHGFPELAYTWRRLLLPLAAAGFHVVAPDVRGYGRTTGWDASSYAHANLAQFSQPQLVLDAIALLRALGGHAAAAAVVGHDFGASAAAACALARPDLFRAAVFISHVPTGPPPLPPLGGSDGGDHRDDPDIHTALARRPAPLQHYQWYNSGARAAHDWATPPQGLRAFLRGYAHLKSAAWAGNAGAAPLRGGWTADELARMPGYYVMPLGATMPEVVARDMARCCGGEEDDNDEEGEQQQQAGPAPFVSDAELDVYVGEFGRTGFQGMLNWYRSTTDPRDVNVHMAMFAGRRFEVPVTYLGGVADWGNYQRPGALEDLQSGKTAADYRPPAHGFYKAAGHWPQVEVPDELCASIVAFLGGL